MTDSAKLFLLVNVEETGLPPKQEVVRGSVKHRYSEKGARLTFFVGLKYAVGLEGLTHEMLGHFYITAGMENGSLRLHFTDGENGAACGCTSYIFTVRDGMEVELPRAAAERRQAIDKFYNDVDVDEVAGRYVLKIKEDARDTVHGEVLDKIQSLLNFAKMVVKDRGPEACGPGSIRVPDFKDKVAVVKWFQSLKAMHVTWADVNDYLKEVGYPKKGKYATGKKRGDWIPLFIKRHSESAE